MPAQLTLPQDVTASYDPDGHNIVNRTRLGPSAAGGDSVAGGTPNAPISASVLVAPNEGFLQRLYMVCTAAPAASVIITLNDGPTTPVVLLKIPVTATMPVGQVLPFDFPTPLRSQSGKEFAVTLPANAGTWLFFVNGFVMRIDALV